MSLKAKHNSGEGCELTQFRHFAARDPETLAELESICRMRRYRAGQTVVDAGEAAEFIGCVRRGYLRMQKTLTDGRQHIVGLLVEGNVFGRAFGEPPNFAIEAATDAEVCAFARAPFEALLERSPELDRMMLLDTLNELDRARDWMMILSNQKVSGRVAGFLLVLCSRFAELDHLLRPGGEGIDIQIPISRPDLAHLLGSRVESISRGIHALKDAGHVEILRPDLIRILDIRALATAAGDESLAEGVNLKDIVTMLRKKT